MHVVDCQSHALRYRANRLEQMLALGSARLHVNHHIRRDNFADAFLDGVA